MTMLVVLGSWQVSAKTILDVYGTDPATAAKIIKKYGPQVIAVEEQMSPTSLAMTTNPDAIFAKKVALIEKIKKEGDFAYGEWTTVLYPGNQNQYTTIEVIDKQDKPRLNFVNIMQKNDLITAMMTYQMLAFKLMMSGALGKEEIQCPFYHCITGYEHPELKPYLPIFKTGVQKDKQLVLRTLKLDLDPSRRAVAALLVGHFTDPNEIVTVLLSYVQDPDLSVRNNAIRVIGETIFRGKLKSIPVEPFITLLDSPVVSDRNKSLLVLLSLIDSTEVKAQLRAHGVSRLLRLIALKQPNNHDVAYLLLKKISEKNFGERDLISWQAWAKQNALG